VSFRAAQQIQGQAALFGLDVQTTRVAACLEIVIATEIVYGSMAGARLAAPLQSVKAALVFGNLVIVMNATGGCIVPQGRVPTTQNTALKITIAQTDSSVNYRPPVPLMEFVKGAQIM